MTKMIPRKGRVFGLFFVMFALSSGSASALEVMDLRCEDLPNPIGIDIRQPRLSWRMESDANRTAQQAYQVLCATSPGLLSKGAADLWDSGKVTSHQSQHVVYAGKKLARGMPCYWSVRIWPVLSNVDGPVLSNAEGDESDAASHPEIVERLTAQIEAWHPVEAK